MNEKVLTSGYTVRIRGLGPFSFSHVTLKYPQLPPVVRIIELATGDTGEWPYDPPEQEPDREEDPEEWELWARWKSTEYENAQNKTQADRERVEFFKLNCIDVIKTPYPSLLVWTVNAYKWLQRLFGRPVLSVPGRKRYLRFLDVEVIRNADDWQWMQTAAYVPEVTLDGILNTASSLFRSDIRGQPAHSPDDPGSSTIGDHELQHEDLGSASGTGEREND